MKEKLLKDIKKAYDRNLNIEINFITKKGAGIACFSKSGLVDLKSSIVNFYDQDLKVDSLHITGWKVI